MSITHIAFYPSDWLAGTRGLSDAETGVYITLICRMYEMAGPIERDDERLARLCGCRSKSSFVKALTYLIEEGKITEVDGALFNDRAQKEIEKVTSISSKARSAAEERWKKKRNKNNKGSDASASVEHMPQPCQPEPEPDIKETTNVVSQSELFPKPEKPKRKTQFPEGWMPDEKLRAWAREKGHDDRAIDVMAERCVNHHRAKGNTFLDHAAAFRTWVLGQARFSTGSPQATSPRPAATSYESQADAIMRRRRSREAQN